MASDIALLGAHPTESQLAKIQERANILRRKIDSWQGIQLLYMPFVCRLRADEESRYPSSDVEPVEAIRLWLPSAVQFTVTSHVQCPAQLCLFEWKLRYAQANDALKEIRNLLRLRSHLYKFKDHNLVGQAANTRARGTINKADSKIYMAASRYEAARAALVNLAPTLNEDPSWMDTFKHLNRSRDLKALKDVWEKETEGTRVLSWIWKTPGLSEDVSIGLHDGEVLSPLLMIWLNVHHDQRSA